MPIETVEIDEKPKKSRTKKTDETSIKEVSPSEPTTNKFKIVDNYLSSRYDFRYNTLRLEVEYQTKKEPQPWEIFDFDRHALTVWRDLQISGVQVTTSFVNDAITSRAVDFNPIADYFAELKERKDLPENAIEMLALTVKVGHDSEDWPRLLRRWLCASVACALGLRHNDVMLLFISEAQGIGKTRWLNRLCPDALTKYRHTGHVNLDKDETGDYLAEMFLLNIDDQLASIFGRDFEKIKGFISADRVTNRKKYARRAKSRKRVANIVGSVNRVNLLPDNENRRYLAFETLEINHDHIIPIDAVWREAYIAITEGGESWGFDSNDFAAINRINSRFAETNEETESITNHFAPATKEEATEFLTSQEILTQLNNLTGLKLNWHKIGRALRRLGFEPRSGYRAGNSIKGYYVKRISGATPDEKPRNV